MKSIIFFISLFFFISCGTDDVNAPLQEEMEEVITPDNQEDEPDDNDDDEEPDDDDDDATDFSIPDIVVVGKNLENNQDLYFIQWEEDYTNRIVQDIRAQISIVNPELLSSSGDSFFVRDAGTVRGDVYKYDINGISPETYAYDTYFPDNTDDTDISVTDARTNYLSAYFYNSSNTDFHRSIYTYNLATGASKTVSLENVDLDFDLTKIFNTYVVSVGNESSNLQEKILHIFSPETDQEALLPFNEYGAVIYNNLTNELFLFEGASSVLDYDVFDLDSFEITRSGTLQTSIALSGVFPDSYFYEDKMLYTNIEVFQGEDIQTPAIYDFSLGEKLVFDLSVMLSSISDSGEPISIITAVNLDLETETIVVGFDKEETSDVYPFTSGVTFFTYDYEIKRTIETLNVKVETIILKD